MTDMSGPYSEATGLGDMLAARSAFEDFVKRHPDIGVEMTSVDMECAPAGGENQAGVLTVRRRVDVRIGLD